MSHAYDRRAYEIEWAKKQTQWGSGSSVPVSDPLSARYSAGGPFAASPSIVLGRIVDGSPYAQCYRVLLDASRPVYLCSALTQSSTGRIGAVSSGVYALDTPVVVAIWPRSLYGIILGACRTPSVTPLGINDFIHQANRCGIAVDNYQSEAYRTTDQGGLCDFSSGGPLDVLNGDWGFITETGLRLHLDPFMAQLAADEFTGLFVFYRDQLTRLAGMNLQIFSVGGEREVLNDEGEVHEYDGTTPYPWEQAGALDPDTRTTRDVSIEDSMFKTPYYGVLEPADDRQQAFHRILKLGGYIGQGGKCLILAPTGGGIFKYGGKGPVALAEEHASLTGRLFITSAKGIHIAKRVAIPAPTRLKRVEDAQGDNPDNYKAAGNFGDGPDHIVFGQPDATDALTQVAGIVDLHAYVFNWEAQHALHYHKNDWRLPEVSSTDQGKAVKAPPSFEKLNQAQFLDRPPAVNVTVDHRYEDVPYYPNEASLDLNDDGSIVLGDGYAAEHRMHGGSQFVDAPGDIVIRAGRNIILMAGGDVILRANRSADISANQNDVRIKAGANLHALADTGGVLIESRGTGFYDFQDKVGEDVVSGGVALKAAKGPVTTWARDIYLRTGGDGQDKLEAGGAIFFDAGSGNGEIVVNCADFTRYMTGQAADFFTGGEAAGNATAANVASSSGTVIGGSLSVNGGVTASEGGTFGGDLQVTSGHVYTQQASANSFLVGWLDDTSGLNLSVPKQNVQNIGEGAQQTAEDGNKAYAVLFTNGIYTASQMGNDQVIASAMFSFRSEAQYRTAGFVIPEARWQQAARLGGVQLDAWTETAMVAASQNTYPYPGAAWAKKPTFQTQDLSMADPKTGLPKDRTDAAYQTPQYPAAKRVIADGTYPVIGE